MRQPPQRFGLMTGASGDAAAGAEQPVVVGEDMGGHLARPSAALAAHARQLRLDRGELLAERLLLGGACVLAPT